MADTERLNLRELPAVEPLPAPGRFSQTFLGKSNSCRRSGYLYLRHGGGTPAVQLDFGQAFHLFAERAMAEMALAGETTLYSSAAGDPDAEDARERLGEDPALAARAVGSLTAAMVDEILREHRELTLPVTGDYSVDRLRECAYHFAIGNDVDPATVVGIERKFVLDLPCGITVSGKIDVATLDLSEPRHGGVHDYKTTWNMPSQGDFEDRFQVPFYAVLLVFGQPVEEVVCGDCAGSGRIRVPTARAPAPLQPRTYGCEACGGAGVIELRRPPVGEFLQWVTGREIYPRLQPKDGVMRNRYSVFSRQQLLEKLHDIDGVCAELMERVGIHGEHLEHAWRFPAIPGSHCSECPCEPECPLPRHLRRFAGTINTEDEAREAAELVARTTGWQGHPGGELTATKREIKNWCSANGPLRYGTDRVLEFATTEAFETDWDGLLLAIERRANYGEPFEITDYRKPRVSSSFRSRRLTAEELAAERSEEVEVHGDSRWGEDAPF